MTIPLAVAAGKTQQMRPGETIPIAYGGTGSTTASAALVALGAEIALGNPGTSGYVLSSTTGGVRSWVPQGAFSGILASSQGGTGVNNGSFTLTVPATGTAVLLNVAQTFSATNTFSAGLNVGTATGAGTGQIKTSGNISAPTATITPGTFGVSTGLTVVNGDITTYRSGGTTGVIYLNSSGTRYLYNDGTDYILYAAQLKINGSLALHAGNYTSYVPTLTGSGASGTWGISVTGNAAYATNAGTASSAESLSRFLASTAVNPISGADGLSTNAIGYVNAISILGQWDGALYSQYYSSSWQHQIYGDYRSGQIALRSKNSGTWQSWRTVLDHANTGTELVAGGDAAPGANKLVRTNGSGYTYLYYINSSSPANENGSISQVITMNDTDTFYRKSSIGQLTAAVQANASGTWGINISGNAATTSQTAFASLTVSPQASGSPYLTPRITLYNDGGNFSYFSYGSDAIPRLIASQRGTPYPLYIGHSTGYGTGDFTRAMSISVNGTVVDSNLTAGTSGTNIGTHPTYGASFGGVWRGSDNYALLFDTTNTFVNSRSGGIYFRDNNVDRAVLNSTGLSVAGALLVNGNYTLYASGGPVSIDVQQAGTAAMWYGRIATRNANGKAAFLGTYGASVAGVFAHSGALDAWADLYVNTVNGSTGGNVRLPEATYINGSLALHAGNVSSYAVTSGSSPTFGAVYTSNWFRSLGNTGWYNGTYEGGILMQDSSTIRTYGSKNFFVENGNLTVSGTITAYQGLTWESWQGVYGHGSGWWNYGGEYSGFGYAKDSLGIVHLRGLVCTNTTSILVATLPEGYRPTGREIFVCDSSAGRVRVDVRANGQILAMEMTGAYGYLSLAGITFRVF